jgi:transposase
MEATEVLSEILYLGDDWEISSIKHTKETSQIDITLSYTNKKGYCPQTGELSPVYDYRPIRKWQHLPLFQCKTFIHCRVPRVRNSLGDVYSIEVPWAEESKRYSFFLKNMF